MATKIAKWSGTQEKPDQQLKWILKCFQGWILFQFKIENSPESDLVLLVVKLRPEEDLECNCNTREARIEIFTLL